MFYLWIFFVIWFKWYYVSYTKYAPGSLKSQLSFPSLFLKEASSLSPLQICGKASTTKWPTDIGKESWELWEPDTYFSIMVYQCIMVKWLPARETFYALSLLYCIRNCVSSNSILQKPVPMWSTLWLTYCRFSGVSLHYCVRWFQTILRNRKHYHLGLSFCLKSLWKPLWLSHGLIYLKILKIGGQGRKCTEQQIVYFSHLPSRTWQVWWEPGFSEG